MKTMKKILCGVTLVLVMALAASCGTRQPKNVVEEEAVETVDSVEVAVDTLQVAE